MSTPQVAWISSRAYLRRVVEGEAGRALNIVVSSISERVVRANNDLMRCNTQHAKFTGTPDQGSPTGWLLPGSFTVTNCSSLYFSNAGARSEMMSGDEMARALMSASLGSIHWWSIKS